jgi:hypothetical protein
VPQQLFRGCLDEHRERYAFPSSVRRATGCCGAERHGGDKAGIETEFADEVIPNL